MTVSSISQTRILIGAGSFVDAIAALNILGRLTLDGNTRFGGLLVEESDALALCQIPNQRIVSASGSLVLAPSLSQVRTLIEADAKAFRRSLAQVAGFTPARWTFEQSIGDLVQKSLQASTGWDIVIFGHRNIHPIGGKIVLLQSSTSVNDDLFAFSNELARRLAAEHVIFSVGQSPGNARKPNAFDTIKDALASLGRINAQAVLVDMSHGPIHTSVELRQLLAVSRCPVFVFEATLTDHELEHSTQIPPAPNTESSAGGL